MYVPSYVPQPIEIPANVANERYTVRLAFIRRVVAVYLASLVIIGLISLMVGNWSPFDLMLVLVAMLALSLARELAKGRDIEQRLSFAVSPALLIGLGMCVHKLIDIHWPVWGMVIGVGCATVYTFSCGRDLSFLGMWALSISCSTVLILVFGWHEPGIVLIELLLANAIYLSYFVYDLAALLTRRRLGEEVGAVVDLYRDVLNMFSYPVRVWNHWRTHKIWVPRP